MLKIISALKIRKNLGEILEEVFYKREHFIIKRGNKPMAAIISVPEYETFRRQKEKGFDLLETITEEGKAVSPTQARIKREKKQVEDAVSTEDDAGYIYGSDVY